MCKIYKFPDSTEKLERREFKALEQAANNMFDVPVSKLNKLGVQAETDLSKAIADIARAHDDVRKL